jgi:carboxymethylenebutenolidase
MGEFIELVASDGHRLSAWRSTPIGAPRGAIVVIQEIFGVNGHIRSVTDGFAAEGYLAIAPALFDRLRAGVDLGYGADDVEEGRALRGQIKTDLAKLDVDAAVRAAKAAGNVGIVGYCWGGLVAWAASEMVDGLACSVAYYGGGIPDHPEIRPRCPVMMHFGRADAMIPVHSVDQFGKAHPEVAIFLYDAGHGFNCDQRPSFDYLAAQQARARTLDFFREHVG